MPTEPPSLTTVFVTMMRQAHARRFIESIRHVHPDLPITVAEQADPPGELTDLEAGGVRRLLLPFDTGLGKSRNHLIESVETDYFLLADDDFFVTAPLPLRQALRFLQAHPDVVFLGGHVTDVVYVPGGTTRRKDDRRDSNLALDTTGRGVVLLPREIVGGPRIVFEDEEFEQCDYVANWGLGRTKFFKDTGFRWSEKIKIGIEHLDFFLRLKILHPEVKVYCWQKLKIEHHRHRDREDAYDHYRRRSDFIREYRQESEFRYLCLASLGRVEFFADYPAKVYLPHPDSVRAAGERERFLILQGKYTQLKESYIQLRAKYMAMRDKYLAQRARITTGPVP
jgi:hypothetical protein